jgi:hypothetical protein
VEIEKVTLAAAHNRLNQCNVHTTAVHSLKKGGGMLPTSSGNYLLKEGISASGNPFSLMQCFFDQYVCKAM